MPTRGERRLISIRCQKEGVENLSFPAERCIISSKIFYVVQELLAFSLTDHAHTDRPTQRL